MCITFIRLSLNGCDVVGESPEHPIAVCGRSPPTERHIYWLSNKVEVAHGLGLRRIPHTSPRGVLVTLKKKKKKSTSVYY